MDMVPMLFGVALGSMPIALGVLMLSPVISAIVILLLGVEFCVRPPYKRSFTVHSSAL